jgi:hypothetical protein
MPTNVTAEYAAAELEYTNAKTTAEKIKALEKMLSTVPKHKGTEKLQQEIKSKIAKLRKLLKKETEQKKRGFSLAIKKEGAAQVIIVGPPNTGKSLLLSKLTNAKPDIADYDFTTIKPEMGVMDYYGVKLQVVEIPAIIRDSAIKGQGPAFFSIIRNADLIIITTDMMSSISTLLKEFEKSDIKLNKPAPGIRIKKHGTGGIEFVGQNNIKADIKKIKAILRDAAVHNAVVEVTKPSGIPEFKDAVNESLTHLKAIIVLTKSDLPGSENFLEGLQSTYKSFEVIPVSLTEDINLGALKDRIWSKLSLIRIYTKEPGKKPKTDEPICLKKTRNSIRDMAQHIHKDFIKKFKYARIWGSSVKHPGSQVGIDHRLDDRDIVELHMG